MKTVLLDSETASELGLDEVGVTKLLEVTSKSDEGCEVSVSDPEGEDEAVDAGGDEGTEESGYEDGSESPMRRMAKSKGKPREHSMPKGEEGPGAIVLMLGKK